MSLQIKPCSEHLGLRLRSRCVGLHTSLYVSPTLLVLTHFSPGCWENLGQKSYILGDSKWDGAALKRDRFVTTTERINSLRLCTLRAQVHAESLPPLLLPALTEHSGTHWADHMCLMWPPLIGELRLGMSWQLGDTVSGLHSGRRPSLSNPLIPFFSHRCHPCMTV